MSLKNYARFITSAKADEFSRASHIKQEKYLRKLETELNEVYERGADAANLLESEGIDISELDKNFENRKSKS